MDTNTSISSGLFFVAFAFIFGLVAFFRSGKAESKIEGEWRGGANTNLKLILHGNDEMKARLITILKKWENANPTFRLGRLAQR
jgi:hypothetical protein